MGLAQQLERGKDARIWAVSYDLKRDAFRVAMEDGRIFLLKRPIPEDDRSEILDVYIEGDGEIFTVIQATGNEFSVPWDVIENLSTGKTGQPGPAVGKRIGQRVKALRKQRGLTQVKLAEMAGLKRPNISRLEAGAHVPGILRIEQLARALQVDVVDLIG
ncbi:MAG: helix-turn-helix transcriptional regulator [Desulfatiglandaceae bacterium]